MATSPAVVLIFAYKAELDWFEKVALRQCVRVLGRHPIRLVCPEGLNVEVYRAIAPDLAVDFIPAGWMSSVRAYNRLHTLPFLYERYADFEFMLIHQLDAFVFRDELAYWCGQGWDYIGAPWFEDCADPYRARPIGVGNGGFSLRRISAHLEVMHTWRTMRPAKEVLTEWWTWSALLPNAPWRILGDLVWRNCFHYRLNAFDGHEDGFWNCAGNRIEGFRVAPYEAARRFSFECNAQRLYAECGKRLPFGCHAWQVRHTDFWRPFIEAEGYTWPRSEDAAKSAEAAQPAIAF